MTGLRASVVTSVRSRVQKLRPRSKEASVYWHTRHNKGRRFDVVLHLVHVGRTRKEGDGHERSEAEERRGLSEVVEPEHIPSGAQGSTPSPGAQPEGSRQAREGLAGHHIPPGKQTAGSVSPVRAEARLSTGGVPGGARPRGPP